MTVSLLFLLLAADTSADPAAAPANPPSASVEAVIETAPMTERLKVPALTPVFIKVDRELSSKKSKPGERFPIVVAEDVRVDGHVVIPAGSAGEGEVVHAARSSVGGKAGELILAARYVKVGEVDVPLRSMVLGGAGKDRSNESLAASFVYGVGFFVVGGAVIVPRESLASAKTAVEIELPVQLSAPAAPPDAPAEATPAAPVDGNKGGETDETKTT
jgi:hypothetical protein